MSLLMKLIISYFQPNQKQCFLFTGHTSWQIPKSWLSPLHSIHCHNFGHTCPQRNGRFSLNFSFLSLNLFIVYLARHPATVQFPNKNRKNKNNRINNDKEQTWHNPAKPHESERGFSKPHLRPRRRTPSSRSLKTAGGCRLFQSPWEFYF